MHDVGAAEVYYITHIAHQLGKSGGKPSQQPLPPTNKSDISYLNTSQAFEHSDPLKSSPCSYLLSVSDCRHHE